MLRRSTSSTCHEKKDCRQYSSQHQPVSVQRDSVDHSVQPVRNTSILTNTMWHATSTILTWSPTVWGVLCILGQCQAACATANGMLCTQMQTACRPCCLRLHDCKYKCVVPVTCSYSHLPHAKIGHWGCHTRDVWHIVLVKQASQLAQVPA